MSWRGFVQMRWHRQALAVCVIAFLVRFGYLVGTGQIDDPPPPYNEQVRIARYLLHGTGFVSPVGPERHDPSSWYAPGYIAIIAAIFRMFGEDSTAAWVAMRVVNLSAHAAALAIWVVVARYLLGRRTAAMAAVLMILSPAISREAAGIWDTYVAMLGGAVCVAVFVLRRLRTVAAQLFAGALCGLVANVNPCFTFCYPVWYVWNRRRYSERSEVGRRRADTHAAPDGRGRQRFTGRFVWSLIPLLIGFGAVITPWTLRNRVVFGEWFYMRGNLGLEMWVGAAPWSDGSFFAYHGGRVHPVFDQAQARRLVQRGEHQYFKDCMQEALTWWRAEPWRVLGSCARRVKWFWIGRYPPGQSWAVRGLKIVGLTLVGLLALAGAVHCVLCRRECWILLGTMLIFPLPYYTTVLAVRYRVPLEPVLLLMAAWLLCESRLFQRHAPAPNVQAVPITTNQGQATPTTESLSRHSCDTGFISA